MRQPDRSLAPELSHKMTLKSSFQADYLHCLSVNPQANSRQWYCAQQHFSNSNILQLRVRHHPGLQGKPDLSHIRAQPMDGHQILKTQVYKVSVNPQAPSDNTFALSNLRWCFGWSLLLTLGRLWAPLSAEKAPYSAPSQVSANFSSGAIRIPSSVSNVH